MSIQNEDEFTLLAKMFASRGVIEGHKIKTFVFHDFDGLDIGPNEQVTVIFQLTDMGINSRIHWLQTEAEAMAEKVR